MMNILYLNKEDSIPLRSSDCFTLIYFYYFVKCLLNFAFSDARSRWDVDCSRVYTVPNYKIMQMGEMTNSPLVSKIIQVIPVQ